MPETDTRTTAQVLDAAEAVAKADPPERGKVPAAVEKVLEAAEQELNPPTKVVTICEKGHRHELDSYGVPGMFGSSFDFCGHPDCDEAPVVDHEVLETEYFPLDPNMEMLAKLAKYTLAFETFASPAVNAYPSLLALARAVLRDREPHEYQPSLYSKVCLPCGALGGNDPIHSTAVRDAVAQLREATQ